MPTVFFAFRDAPDRRAALERPGSLDRYRLFGLDELRAHGAEVRHNLEREGRPPLWARLLSRTLNRLLAALGGYGGDFASMLASLRTANSADVVFATTDTVGLPLVLLKRAGLVRPPLVYAAIGLPERLEHLRGRRTQRLYRGAFRRVETLVVYAESERDRVRSWLGADAPRVVFVPFGVDVDAFAPTEPGSVSVDVVSVGADPRRDFELLLAIAARHPELSFHIVAARDRASSLRATPNVTVESDLPLETVRERLAAARVVALPVQANSYSGATTVLLQAMALGKPVVVSLTDAISAGYALEDRVNCRLVGPGDVDAFERALLETLTGADASVSLGSRARESVARDFSWKRYTDTLREILFAAASGGGRSRPSP
jgi:glycosyltransferase involved in cell wall biosynthesis